MKNRKSNRPIFVCVCGIDGSGKSTLTEALTRGVGEQGIRVRHVYCRMDSAVLRHLAWGMKRLLSLRGRNMADGAERATAKKQLLDNHFLSCLYEGFVTLDYLAQILVRVKVPLARGQSVICDRYVYDTVIDLAIDLRYSERKSSRMIDVFFRFAPKPHLVFLIDLPEELAHQRNLAKGDSISLAQLAVLRKHYLGFSHEYGLVVLDGSKSASEVEAAARDGINEVIHGQDLSG